MTSISSEGGSSRHRLKVLDGVKMDMDGLLEESCVALEEYVTLLPG